MYIFLKTVSRWINRGKEYRLFLTWGLKIPGYQYWFLKFHTSIDDTITAWGGQNSIQEPIIFNLFLNCLVYEAKYTLRNLNLKSFCRCLSNFPYDLCADVTSFINDLLMCLNCKKILGWGGGGGWVISVISIQGRVTRLQIWGKGVS